MNSSTSFVQQKTRERYSLKFCN